MKAPMKRGGFRAVMRLTLLGTTGTLLAGCLYAFCPPLPGTFACGPNVSCVPGREYCRKFNGSIGGNSYACGAMPSCNPGETECQCLQRSGHNCLNGTGCHENDAGPGVECCEDCCTSTGC